MSNKKRSFFHKYDAELERLVGDSKTLLDVGCGSGSPIKIFSHKLHAEGVDAFIPSIEKSKQQKIHNKYHNIDVLDIDKQFESNSFDCVVALDLIEHLEKEKGLELMQKMEKIAKKRVIIFTPNGFLPQGEFENNPWQIHRSGWEVEEMQKYGYNVYGINGLKGIRGEFATIKYKPKIFWNFISNISQLYTYNNPKLAFQILCVKQIG